MSTEVGAKVMHDVESLSVSVLVSYLVVVLNARPYDGIDGELALLNESRRSHAGSTSPTRVSVSLGIEMLGVAVNRCARPDSSSDHSE